MCLCVGVCAASQLEGLSRVPVVSGLVQQLQEAFPREPLLAVEKAVADGLVHALDDESLDLHDVMCDRDYSRLCPEGWTDIGDGSSCAAPVAYQGKCGLKLQMGGLAPSQKRQQAAKCGASYACLGACTPDSSKPCPLGWLEDVNHDCLAPAGYSGRCVGRKSFSGMSQLERRLWAKRCDVTWPCHRTQQDATEIERMNVEGIFNSDCVPDYSSTCPARYVLKGQFCQAPSGFSRRCGLTLPAKYTTTEKKTYAETCLTKWPCCMVLFTPGASI